MIQGRLSSFRLSSLSRAPLFVLICAAAFLDCTGIQVCRESPAGALDVECLAAKAKRGSEVWIHRIDGSILRGRYVRVEESSSGARLIAVPSEMDGIIPSGAVQDTIREDLGAIRSVEIQPEQSATLPLFLIGVGLGIAVAMGGFVTGFQ